MKKIALALILPIFSVNAGILDKLKDTPASKYEVGALRLELASYVLNNKLQGEKIKGTDFKINKFSVEEAPEKLVFKMAAIGRSKHLTQAACAQVNTVTQQIITKEKFIRDVWPALSEKQYRDLDKEFSVKTELVSKENRDFSVSCY